MAEKGRKTSRGLFLASLHGGREWSGVRGNPKVHQTHIRPWHTSQCPQAQRGLVSLTMTYNKDGWDATLGHHCAPVVVVVVVVVDQCDMFNFFDIVLFLTIRN